MLSVWDLTMSDHTTISLARETRDKLFRQKESPDDSYDDVIRSLIDEEN